MCASPVGNGFMKDFVAFVVTGKKVTGRVHDFLYFEEKVVFLLKEVLEQYRNDCGSWIISGLHAVHTSECYSVCATRSRHMGGCAHL